jgi:hypothetical protein
MELEMKDMENGKIERHFSGKMKCLLRKFFDDT